VHRLHLWRLSSGHCVCGVFHLGCAYGDPKICSFLLGNTTRVRRLALVIVLAGYNVCQLFLQPLQAGKQAVWYGA
jgi:hypothetical protein